jgi:DNA-binding FadR family transcriptional regulator
VNLSDSQTGGPRHVSAIEAVLADIRGVIESGSLAVGDKLPSEAQLARQYGVSRPLLREALRGLQALGLVVSHSGKGSYVASNRPVENPIFGSYSLRDLLEVRKHVEIPISGYAALRHTDDDLDMLESLIERMEEENDSIAWVALDTLFHITIAQASGNPAFQKVIEEVRDALGRQSRVLNQVGGRREFSNAEHRRIVEAITAGDDELARQAMADHLQHVESAWTSIVHAQFRPTSKELNTP